MYIFSSQSFSKVNIVVLYDSSPKSISIERFYIDFFPLITSRSLEKGQKRVKVYVYI